MSSSQTSSTMNQSRNRITDSELEWTWDRRRDLDYVPCVTTGRELLVEGMYIFSTREVHEHDEPLQPRILRKAWLTEYITDVEIMSRHIASPGTLPYSYKTFIDNIELCPTASTFAFVVKRTVDSSDSPPGNSTLLSAIVN